MRLRWVHLLFFVAIIVMLTGCLPPNFTNEKVKEVRKLHEEEPYQWFREHMPEAKTSKKSEPYKTGTDLYAAMEGTYQYRGTTYEYLYDYVNQIMYVEDGYEEACERIAKELIPKLHLEESKTEPLFLGYGISLYTENDNPRNQDYGAMDSEEAEEGTTEDSSDMESALRYKLIPFGVTPAEVAEQAISGSVSLRFAFYTYDASFSEYQPEVYETYPNLSGINYSYPIDCQKGFQGVYKSHHSINGVDDEYCHIEEISEGLYGGYVWKNNVPVEDLLQSYVDGDEITLVIPQKTSPVFFSEKKEKLMSHFINAKGKEIIVEAGPLYRTDCKGTSEYQLFDNNLMIKRNVSYGYKRNPISSTEEYHFTRK